MFGGVDDADILSDILRYDPITGSVTDMGEMPVFGSHEASAVWTGTYAYVVGGVHPSDAFVVRYNPATNVATAMGPKLAYGLFEASAVWTGTHVYVFGGYNPYTGTGEPTGYKDRILRYDPATDTLQVMNARLPTPRSMTSAIWDGTHAYVFGGYNIPGGCKSQIVKYDPLTDTATALSTQLWGCHWRGSAVWTGTEAYVFDNGGDVDKFTPATSTLVNMPGDLARGADSTSAVWGNGQAYVFGGWDSDSWDGTPSGFSMDLIQRYSLDLPSRPTSFSVAAGPGDGQIQLAWAAPAAPGSAPVDAYVVQRGPAQEGPMTTIATLGASTLSYTDSGLGHGTTRHYRVLARNAFGTGSPTPLASATTFTLPGAPTSPTAAAGPGLGEISVSWSAPSTTGGSAIASYNVYRATAIGGPYSLVATVTGTSYLDAGLGNGVTRYYRVSAVNVAGEGPQTGAVSATTFNVPGAPRFPAATAGPGVGEIRVTWSAPSSNGGKAITGYQVYRAASASGPFALRASLGVVTSYTDAGLGNGATWHYRISAVNVVGEGAQTGTVSATTFALAGAPQSLTAEPGPALGDVTLEWQPPASNGGTPVTGYRVFRSTAATGPFDPIAQVGAVLTYVDHDRPVGQTFHYRVTALNLVGEGAPSNVASALGTKPPV